MTKNKPLPSTFEKNSYEMLKCLRFYQRTHSGVDGEALLAKLNNLARRKPAEQLNMLEASTLSWAYGVAIHASLAAKDHPELWQYLMGESPSQRFDQTDEASTRNNDN